MADEHLDPDAAHIARCDRCNRVTWEPDAWGYVCSMPQPDGTRCLGTFVITGDPA